MIISCKFGENRQFIVFSLVFELNTGVVIVKKSRQGLENVSLGDFFDGGRGEGDQFCGVDLIGGRNHCISGGVVLHVLLTDF